MRGLVDYSWVRCSDIIINKQKVNEQKLDEYTDMMAATSPSKFPPVVVRQTSEGPVLVDGRHRLAANKALGYVFIRARFTL